MTVELVILRRLGYITIYIDIKWISYIHLNTVLNNFAHTVSYKQIKYKYNNTYYCEFCELTE